MMDDKQLTEEYLDGKVVFPGKIIRVEHWHVRLPNGVALDVVQVPLEAMAPVLQLLGALACSR